MSESNTRTNDIDLRSSIRISHKFKTGYISDNSRSGSIKKDTPMINIKSQQSTLVSHQRISNALVSSKNVIPPLLDSSTTNKSKGNIKKTKSLKLSTSTKSRNELNQLFQSLNSNLTPYTPTPTMTVIANNPPAKTQPSTTVNKNNNEINYKDRKLIRKSTLMIKSRPSNDQDDMESMNQLTQFKPKPKPKPNNDIGNNLLMTMTKADTDPSRNKASPLTLAVTEAEPDILHSNTTQRTYNNTISNSNSDRYNNPKRELKRLMKINPYQSLKNNFKYTFNQNQLTYIKESQKTHRLLNYNSSKDKKVIYKVNNCSTLFLRKETVKGNLIKRLIQRKSDLPADLKAVIFWQGVKWLWMNYSSQIKKLLFSFINFKWFLDKSILLSRNAMNELFSIIQINKSNEFAEGLFLVFNENKSLQVNMKIIINVFIATKDCTYKEKIQETMNVWANDEDDAITLAEIADLAQLVFQYKNDVKKLIELIKRLLNITEFYSARVNKVTLGKLCLTDIQVKYLIKRNKIDLNLYEQMFETEIMNMYNINIRNSKGLIEMSDAQRLCEREINAFEKVLDVIANCNMNRSELKQKIINEAEEY